MKILLKRKKVLKKKIKIKYFIEEKSKNLAMIYTTSMFISLIYIFLITYCQNCFEKNNFFLN